MASVAQGRGKVVFNEEFSEAIIVGGMAGGTLDLALLIEANGAGEAGGILELAVGHDQGGVVNERDRVVVGKVGAQKCRATRERKK
jgi:hypothetical protein